MVKELMSKTTEKKTYATMRRSHRPLRSRSLFTDNFDMLVYNRAIDIIKKETDLFTGHINCLLAIYYFNSIHKSGVLVDAIEEFLPQYTDKSIHQYLSGLTAAAYCYNLRAQDLKDIDHPKKWKGTGYILTRLGEDVIRRLSAILTAERKKIYNPVKQK